MDMVTRFLQSKLPRPLLSQQIPGLAVNFIDVQDTFQKGFVTGEQQGQDSEFTDKAQGYYTDEVKMIVVPPSFVPVEQGIGLHRYTPDHKYYQPGQGQG
jgi:hypothetical protein